MVELCVFFIVVEIAFLIWCIYIIAKNKKDTFWKYLVLEKQIEESKIYIGNALLPMFVSIINAIIPELEDEQ